MKRVSRAQLRGAPLEKDCHMAYTTTNEFGSDDNRVFCYGLYEDMADVTLEMCLSCRAYYENAKPYDEFRRKA